MLPEISRLINFFPRVNHAVPLWPSLQIQDTSLAANGPLRSGASLGSVGVGGVRWDWDRALLNELNGGGFKCGPMKGRDGGLEGR
jgi:hypothetical protein